MKPVKITTAALRANLAGTLRKAGKGATIEVVRYGRVIAQIVPPAPPSK